MSTSWIYPDWPAPAKVKTLVTTRHGGISESPYETFNLALHVNDNTSHVERNRSKLSEYLGIPVEQFCWLNQTHSVNVVDASDALNELCSADGVVSGMARQVCVVMTADCLPILLCDQSGSKVAAVHAGWRGLADGVVQKALDHFDNPNDVLAWLGPAISQDFFEVGSEVRERFISRNHAMESGFVPSKNSEKFMADLYHLARQELASLGVNKVYGGDFCTYGETERFYSYRRDGARSGRMASLIWLES